MKLSRSKELQIRCEIEAALLDQAVNLDERLSIRLV